MTKKYELDGCKLAYHQNRVKAWLRGERVAPILIDMALTKACTYKCDYCYAHKFQDNKGYPINYTVIDNFIDDCACMGVKAISLVSDGESTCNFALQYFVERATDMGLDVALGTNGCLLDNFDIRCLVDRLTYLRFNISAADPERYCEIHGVGMDSYVRTLANMQEAVRQAKSLDDPATIGLQMVVRDKYADQIVPLAKFGKKMGVDYLVLKHCSDDENDGLGVKYDDYDKLKGLLIEAESYSTDDYFVKAKWNKIGKVRDYKECLAGPLMLQISGSGKVTICGMLFGDKYKKYEIGNICKTRFYDLWQSDRYWDVMNEVKSEEFDCRRDCGSNCLQEMANRYLHKVKTSGVVPRVPDEPIQHVNFI